jgi:outer membrane protein assembly factor BamB
MRTPITAVVAGMVFVTAGCKARVPSEEGKTPAEPGAAPAAVAPAAVAPAAVAADPETPPPDSEIVTAEVVKLNGDNYGRPPVTFRKGNPTKRSSPKATRTANGFSVQFPSRATMVTPTVYKRKVIVSGGFKSKELYAFDATTGESVWALDLHDDGPSSPACESDVCVISTESCTLFAVDANTGAHLWSYWLGDPLTSAPTIAGNRVFASYPASTASGGKPKPPTATHALAAFDLRSGKILWQIWLEGDVMSAPVAVGQFVYVTTFTGTVIKLEQSSGAIRYAMKARATSAPVVQFAGGVEQMYYTRRGEEAAEAKSGAREMIIRADHNDPKTKYKSSDRKADYLDKDVQNSSEHSAKSTAEDASNGFGGSAAPQAAAAQHALGTVGVGRVSSMQGFQGSRIVKMADRSVNTMGDEVIATDSESGKTLWSHKLSGDLRKQGGFLGTAPLAAGGSILFATLKGDIVRLDAKAGKQVATYAAGSPVRSQPVVDEGWIYVGTDDGKLVAIDTKDRTLTGWSTWGGNAQRTGIAR